MKSFGVHFFLFVGLALMAVSCSEDDEATKKQTTGEAPFAVALFEKKQIELPSDVKTYDNVHAQELVGYFESFTGIYENTGVMTVPPGAEVSHTPVSTGGNRPAARVVATDYTVYTYTVTTGEGTVKMVYQFSVQNGQNVFELFMGTSKLEGLVKLFEIRQNKEGTKGTMKMFIFGQVVSTWTWEIQADSSVFMTYTNSNDSFSMELTYNEDQSGHMELHSTGSLSVEYTWDSAGHGTWTNHKTGESGSW